MGRVQRFEIGILDAHGIASKPDASRRGARIMQAQALRGYAAGNFFPQVQQFSGDYNRIQISGNRANPPGILNYDEWATGFNMSWELDFWGRFRRALEATDATLDASIEDYDNVLVILLSEAATSYTEMRTYQERLRLARREREVAREDSRCGSVAV